MEQICENPPVPRFFLGYRALRLILEKRFCVGPDGNDVEVAPEGGAQKSGGEPAGGHGHGHDHDHDHTHGEGDASSAQGGVNCHFHAGVE